MAIDRPKNRRKKPTTTTEANIKPNSGYSVGATEKNGPTKTSFVTNIFGVDFVLFAVRVVTSLDVLLAAFVAHADENAYFMN